MRRWGWLLFATAFLLLPACGQRVLFSDDFSGSGGDWALEGDAFSRSYITQDALLIEIDEPNMLHYVTLARPELSDFAIEVDARLVAGSGNSSSYGILFRLADDAFYRFEVAPTGVYNVEKRRPDGTWQRLLPSGRWEYSSAILTAPGATNRLRVVVSGTIAVFAVNNTVVQSIDAFDAELNGRTLALNAGSYARGGVLVAFDNVRITTP